MEISDKLVSNTNIINAIIRWKESKNDNMDDKQFNEFWVNAYKGMYESLADGG